MIDLIQNGPLAGAAALSAFTAALHVFAGGPDVAKPLLESDMPRTPKYTIYYCWHIVTITLIAMAAGFGSAAVMATGTDMALSWTLIAAAFAIWSVVLFVKKKMPPLALPQWALFGPIAALGFWGLA